MIARNGLRGIDLNQVGSVLENAALGAGAGLGIPGIVVGNQPPPPVVYPPQRDYTPYILAGFGVIALLLLI